MGLCVGPGINKLCAAAAGIVLASAFILSSHALLDRYVERQSRQEVELTARRGIGLAESRIRRTIVALTDLAHNGIQSCDSLGQRALNATLLRVTPVKELSVIGPDGETLCTNLGESG